MEKLRRELAALDRDLDAAQPLTQPGGPAGRRPPVSPLRNVERFAPVRAKFVRFVVLATNNLEPCLDELEVFSAEKTPRNVALAAVGTRATSSGDYPGAAIHKLEHINDGKYGNGDDVKMSGGSVKNDAAATSKIGAITIGGQLLGTPGGTDHFGFVSQQFGSLSIGGSTFSLVSGIGNDLFDVGITGDFSFREIA